MRFSSRTARVRYIEHLLTTQPFRYTIGDLAGLTEVAWVTAWRDVRLLETECPRLALVADARHRLGLVERDDETGYEGE